MVVITTLSHFRARVRIRVISRPGRCKEKDVHVRTNRERTGRFTHQEEQSLTGV